MKSQYPSETTPVRITSRGVALFVVLLAVSAALLVQGYGFAPLLAVAALLAYWRVAATLFAGATSRLRASRRVLGERVEGRVARVEVEVYNPTPVPLAHVEVYDEPPRLLESLEEPRAVSRVDPFSATRISYRVRLVYGRHVWGPLRIVVYDPLMLFRYERLVHTETVVDVAPRLLGVVRGEYLVPHSPRPGGIALARRKGFGTTIYSVREYTPGDDLRFVDWKGFARTLRLYVKEFEQEVLIRTLLVLDVTPTMYSGVVGETKLEYAARVLATIASYTAARGDTYSLAVVHPGGRLTLTPWLRGRARLPILLRSLSSVEWVEASDGIEPDLHARAIAALARHAGREKTLFFIVTDMFESSEAARIYAVELERLKRLKHEVVVLMPLTAYFEAAALARTGRELEARLYALLSLEKLKQVASMARELAARGVPLVATGPDRLVKTVLERIEAYRRMLG